MTQGRRTKHETPHGFGQSSQARASSIPDTHAGNGKLLSCIRHHCNCGMLLLEQSMVHTPLLFVLASMETSHGVGLFGFIVQVDVVWSS